MSKMRALFVISSYLKFAKKTGTVMREKVITAIFNNMAFSLRF